MLGASGSGKCGAAGTIYTLNAATNYSTLFVGFRKPSCLTPQTTYLTDSTSYYFFNTLNVVNSGYFGVTGTPISFNLLYLNCKVL